MGKAYFCIVIEKLGKRFWFDRFALVQHLETDKQSPHVERDPSHTMMSQALAHRKCP